jgi:hypothetical protein
VAGAVAERLTRPSEGIAIAAPADEAELRALLRASVMPGRVRVALTREPDFFAGDGLAAADDVTLVARRNGRVVGMGRCSVLTLLRNGAPARIGYLAALRITSGTRESARLLRGGYQLLARQCGESVEGFFTSIATDNDRARRVLEQGGRLGLPAYRPLCDLVTLVAPLDHRTRAPDVTPTPERELLDFLRRSSCRAHLTLAWSDSQWQALGEQGAAAREFSVVRRNGEIIAAAAVWDQRRFRQTVIDGYSGAMRILRPLLNGIQAARDLPGLPAPDTVLNQGAVLGASVDDPDDWVELWSMIQRRAAALDLDWVILSRDARDPELPLLRRLLRAREYRTTLYEVTWPDGPRWPDAWDARCFRPEVSLL